MGISITRDAHTLICHVVGEIDHHNAVILRNELDLAMESSDCDAVILDLSRTNFMDSSGIGLIMGRMRKADELEIKFFLSNVSERIGRILKMSGLDKIISMWEGRANEKNL